MSTGKRVGRERSPSAALSAEGKDSSSVAVTPLSLLCCPGWYQARIWQVADARTFRQFLSTRNFSVQSFNDPFGYPDFQDAVGLWQRHVRYLDNELKLAPPELASKCQKHTFNATAARYAGNEVYGTHHAR